MKNIGTLSYTIGNFSQGVFIAFINTIAPLLLVSFALTPNAIGMILGFITLESAIIPLVIGFLSDSISLRFGRRKIFLLLGSLIVCGSLLLIPLIKSASGTIILLCLAGLGRSITVAPYFSLLSANAKLSQRNLISAISALIGLVGHILFVLFIMKNSNITFITYAIVSLLFIVPTGITIVLSHDDKKVEKKEKFSLMVIKNFLRESNKKYYLLSQLFLWFGINSVTPFFLLFMTTYLKLSQQDALLYYFVLVLSSGIFAIPLSLAAKSLGDKKVFIISTFLFAFASFLGIFSQLIPSNFLYLLSILAGVGNSAAVVFGYSMLSKLVSKNEVGKASGMYSFTIAITAPFASLLSGFLIQHVGYSSIFVILFISLILTTVCLWRVSQ